MKPAQQRELKEKELWEQLRNVVNLRSSEDRELWRIFGVFWAACALLLVALFRSGDFPSNSAVGIIISVVGLSLSVAWFLIQRRVLGHVERYEEMITRIERKLCFDPDYTLSPEINENDKQKFLSIRPRARNVMKWFSFLAKFGWLALLIYFIFFN